MSLRDEVHGLVDRGDAAALDDLVISQPRAVRYLLGLSYHADPARRELATRSLARASRHHERLVQRIVRQLVWAMNDESGTNAVTAPGVMLAIAEERPELLLPMVPDLVRLAMDEGLREDLSAALRIVAERCPGEVGPRLGQELSLEMREGRGAR